MTNLISRFAPVAILVYATFVACSPAMAQNRTVTLEVYQSRYAELEMQHRWMEMLSGVGATVRSKASESSVRPSVEEIKSANSTVIRIKGFIDGKTLYLPGGKFSIRDKEGVKNLIQKLKDDGAEVALADKQAFGLTAPQLVALHEDLSRTVDFSTKGQQVGEAVLKMVSGIKTPVVLSAEARKKLTEQETIAEELQGLSIGTSLAATIRPLGLVVQPKREQGKSTKIHLVKFSDAEENWPIGWPVENSLAKAAPDLFKREAFEIKGYPMKSVLDAIERRTKTPFLYDHNSLARRELELTEVRVNFEQKKASYMTAISKVLSQSRPKAFKEIRLDENGKPFVWISCN